MAIVFDTDILHLFEKVMTDPAYSDIPSDRRNTDMDKAILALADIIRAFMAEFRDAEEVMAAHGALTRMLSSFRGQIDPDTVEKVANAARDAALVNFTRNGSPDL